MAKTFQIRIDSVQPTQLYISSEKLDYVMRIFKESGKENSEPIPVKELDGQIILVDGHTRALAAFLLGITEIPVYYWRDENEDEKLDWDEYRVCVGWCKQEGIRAISDLKNRIIPHEEYQILWLDRCEKMQQDLESKRETQRTRAESKPASR